MYDYNPEKIEATWQAYWDEQSTFKVVERRKAKISP